MCEFPRWGPWAEMTHKCGRGWETVLLFWQQIKDF